MAIVFMARCKTNKRSGTIWDNNGKRRMCEDRKKIAEELTDCIKRYKAENELSWNTLAETISANGKEEEEELALSGDTLKHQINRSSEGMIEKFRNYLAALNRNLERRSPPIDTEEIDKNFRDALRALSKKATHTLTGNEA